MEELCKLMAKNLTEMLGKITIYAFSIELDGKYKTAQQHSIPERDRKAALDKPDIFFSEPVIPGNLRLQLPR